MKKFFLIFCIILLDAFLLVGFLVIRDKVSLYRLNKEIYELSKLDLKKDDYNRKIKSSGGYSVVEKTIKKYLNDCSNKTKEIINLGDDDKLKNILSYENYEEDGPNFDKSIKYLENSKSKYDKDMNYLLKILDKNYIYNYGNDKIKDDYYLDQYREYMINGDLSVKLDKHNEYMNKLYNNVNSVYGTCLEILNYLKLYKDDWKLEDGEIKFQTQEMYDYYNSLVSKLS